VPQVRWSGGWGIELRVHSRRNRRGMLQAVIRRCMEPYFSTKPPGGSAGLGLPFVYRLITRSRGRLKLRRAQPVESIEPHAASHLAEMDPPRRRSGLGAEA
jgi:nitrogen fixation/metabolism regulation signal transduction histidine kinase